LVQVIVRRCRRSNRLVVVIWELVGGKKWTPPGEPLRAVMVFHITDTPPQSFPLCESIEEESG